jgi:hypothetical protein
MPNYVGYARYFIWQEINNLEPGGNFLSVHTIPGNINFGQLGEKLILLGLFAPR